MMLRASGVCICQAQERIRGRGFPDGTFLVTDFALSKFAASFLAF